VSRLSAPVQTASPQAVRRPVAHHRRHCGEPGRGPGRGPYREPSRGPAVTGCWPGARRGRQCPC